MYVILKALSLKLINYLFLLKAIIITMKKKSKKLRYTITTYKFII